MSRRLAVAVLVLSALAVAPAAAGDGPMPYASQGGFGVLAPLGRDGPTRFVALGTASRTSTMLALVQTKDSMVRGYTTLRGDWGVPVVTYDQDGTGLSADGRTLVLEDVVTGYPHTRSSFLVLDTKTLRVLRTIELKGDFAFDALSPRARRLYLIQHVDVSDSAKYVVRSYDLARGRLLPGRIADRTQKGWVMKGYPMSRATSAGGRWVYTLYQSSGGFPFVHALDTVRGVAHCIGLPWRGNQNGFYNMRLTLRNGDRTLAAHWLSGRPWLSIDTASWRISRDHRAGFPWAMAAALGSAAGAFGVLAVLLVRRRRREEFEQELVDLLRAPEREVVA